MTERGYVGLPEQFQKERHADDERRREAALDALEEITGVPVSEENEDGAEALRRTSAKGFGYVALSTSRDVLGIDGSEVPETEPGSKDPEQ